MFMREIRSGVFIASLLFSTPSCLEPLRPVESPSVNSAHSAEYDPELSRLRATNGEPTASAQTAEAEETKAEVETSPVSLDAQPPQSKIDQETLTTAPGGHVSRVATRQHLPLGSELQVEFARVLNELHRRIHPYFSDQYLASRTERELDRSVEIELSLLATGELGILGVTRSSGLPEFDAAALESVERALPMDPVDPRLLSSDGHLYVTWEFHSRPEYACSTYFAQPYRLAEE